MNQSCIRTFTGRYFDVLNPKAEDICIEDIAHALANQCRFTGHTRVFYSVAEHSVRASKLVPAYEALSALLHDSTEAYLVDLARPVKHHTPIGPVFRSMEHRIWLAIAEKFALPVELSLDIHRADNIMLATEKRDLMTHNGGDDAYLTTHVLGDNIQPLEDHIIPVAMPFQAADMFLQRYRALTGGVYAVDRNRQ